MVSLKVNLSFGCMDEILYFYEIFIMKTVFFVAPIH